MAMKPGHPARYDYEYKRKGTRNIFVAVEPKAGRRTVTVTKTRKKADFAHFVADLVNNSYRQATEIRIVLDNLNTHFATSFYETFPNARAKALLDKITFCYTPKHGRWLNMAEIELGVMQRECLGPRMESEQLLIQRLVCWSTQRNNQQKKIYWKFTRQDAYQKLSKHYVV